jgi:hypothetical protein
MTVFNGDIALIACFAASWTPAMIRRWHADPFGFLRPWNEVPRTHGQCATPYAPLDWHRRGHLPHGVASDRRAAGGARGSLHPNAHLGCPLSPPRERPRRQAQRQGGEQYAVWLGRLWRRSCWRVSLDPGSRSPESGSGLNPCERFAEVELARTAGEGGAEAGAGRPVTR